MFVSKRKIEDMDRRIEELERKVMNLQHELKRSSEVMIGKPPEHPIYTGWNLYKRPNTISVNDAINHIVQYLGLEVKEIPPSEGKVELYKPEE